MSIVSPIYLLNNGPSMTRPKETRMRYGISLALLLVALAAACAKPAKAPEGIRFKEDLAFLQEKTKVLVLKGADGQAQVAVNPDLQGRVMTSTAAGPDG